MSTNEVSVEVLGANGADVTLPVHHKTLTTGIQPAPEFEHKRLAEFAANAGVKCGNGCVYCSTAAMLRTHAVFEEIGKTSFEQGFAVVDPDAPDRVAEDAQRKRRRGMVMVSTIDDAWAPHAKPYDIGRRYLEGILSEPDWSVRILTKSAIVRDDYDVVEQHRDRVLVGLSLTGLPRHEIYTNLIEPCASPLTERMAAMQEAHERGLRTYGMLCPLMPGIADDEQTIAELIQFCESVGAEEIFAENLNRRGRSVIEVQEVLEQNGFVEEARRAEALRNGHGYNAYIRQLVPRVQAAMRQHSDIEKLRFLLYPALLTDETFRYLLRDPAGIIWLGDGVPARLTEGGEA